MTQGTRVMPQFKTHQANIQARRRRYL